MSPINNSPPLDPTEQAEIRALVERHEANKRRAEALRTPVVVDEASWVASVTMHPVDSSLIEAIGHDPIFRALLVRFASRKPGQRGALYRYENFGDTDWQAFRDAESKGAYFQQLIKPHPDRYPFARVGEDQPE
jgi:hypothetical protein